MRCLPLLIAGIAVNLHAPQASDRLLSNFAKRSHPIPAGHRMSRLKLVPEVGGYRYAKTPNPERIEGEAP